MKSNRLTILFALCVFVLSLGADTYRFGKWAVVAEEGACPQLFYGERQIFSRISCVNFFQAYDGVFTQLAFPKPEISQNAVVWKQKDKEAEFTLVLTLEEQSARFRLSARLQNQGSMEFGFRMPLESLRTEDEYLFLKANGKAVSIGTTDFQNIPLSSFVCELYAEEHQFVNNSLEHRFALQDLRKWDGKSICLVTQETPPIGEMRTWDVSWNVKEFDKETALERGKSLPLAAGSEVCISKLSPALESEVCDNTPELVWQAVKDEFAYVVLLSRDPSFPASETIRREADCASLQIVEPLSPGIWYWKVVGASAVDRKPWSFRQTAPQDQDCMPPEIVTMGYRVLDQGDAVKIAVRELSQEAPSLEVLCGDKAVPVRLESCGDDGLWLFSALPEDGWKKGMNTLVFSVKDSAGNRASSIGWLLNAPRPANAVVINANGRFEENGKPIFPYGIYQVEKDEDMAELRSLGFNAVHTYLWEHSRDDAACRGYLDRCWAADGLRAFVGFDRKAIVNGEYEVVARRVGAIADHPGLFVYYLFDEPEDPKQYVSAPQMNRFADLVRGLDPYHAVVLTTWNHSMFKYRSTWDTHWSQAYGTPGYVVGLVDEHKKYLKNSSPITLLLHCYDNAQMASYRATGKYDVKAFSPDCEWMRCAAWAGICQNVNGVWWWWFCKNDENWLTAPTVPEIWKGFCEMMRELHSYQEFLDSEKMTFGRLSAGRSLVVWGVKKTAGRELLIVANTGTDPVKVSLPAETGHPQTIELGRYGVSLQVY